MSKHAFILAAGLGTRLRPLTETVPKPSVSVGGVPLLYFHLFNLVNQGFKNLHINTHYLSTVIDNLVNTSPWKHHTKIYHEKNILGTGGAFTHVLPVLKNGPMVAINGDVLINFDYANLLNQVTRQNACAGLVTLPHVIKGESPLGCRDDQVVCIGNKDCATRHDQSLEYNNYACVQVLSPKILPYLKDQTPPFSIMDAYREALSHDEKILRFVYNGPWFDIGSFTSLFDANMFLLEVLDGKHDNFAFQKVFSSFFMGQPTFVPSGTQTKINNTLVIGPSLIAHPSGFSLPAAMVGPHAVILAPQMSDQRRHQIENTVIYSWTQESSAVLSGSNKKLIFNDKIFNI